MCTKASLHTIPTSGIRLVIRRLNIPLLSEEVWQLNLRSLLLSLSTIGSVIEFGNNEFELEKPKSNRKMRAMKKIEKIYTMKEIYVTVRPYQENNMYIFDQ